MQPATVAVYFVYFLTKLITMNFFRVLFLTLVVALLSSTASYAQVAPGLLDVVATPQFFVSLLAGILLAIGFQVVLTALSVAAGVSALGNIQKKANKASGTNAQQDSSSDRPGGSSRSGSPVGVKISSGLGAWTMITVSIALFFASLLAVKLSLIGNVIIGITLGLVIWAAFFTTMAYLEIRSVSSLLGALINTAFAGIKQTMSALQDMFTRSQTSKIEDIADHTIRKVREEMADNLDMYAIRDKVDEYVNRMDERAQQAPDYEQMKQDFINILRDVRIEEKTEPETQGQETEIFFKLASEQSNLSKQDVKKMGGVFQQAKQAVQSGETNEDKAKKVATQFTSASEQDIDNYVAKIEDYLRNTNRTELEPDEIRNDIESIIQNPKEAQHIIQRRAGQMDRDTLVALLETNKKMDHAKAEKVVSHVEKALDFVAKKTDQASSKARGQAQQAQGQAASAQQQADGQSRQRAAGLENRLRDYLSRTNRPEIQYDTLKWDIERIMNDPKSSPQIVRNRLSQFDRETFVQLLTANDKISRQDIHRLADKVDQTRQQVIDKVTEVEVETQRRIEQAKQEALLQAENARKTAAAAAWWLFGTAVVSGIAAAAGGLVAIL